MDTENEYNVNPESHMDDELNTGLSEITRKNQSSRVTLLKEEAAESDISDDSLLCRSGKTGNLKSVQEYTGRIKSFLGWDSNEEGDGLSRNEISELSIAKDVSEENEKVCESDAFQNAYHPCSKSSDVICASERDTSPRPIDNVNELGESNERGESRFTELNRNCEETEILHLQQNDPSFIRSSKDNLNFLEPELTDNKSDNSILESVSRRADAKMESFALNDHSSSVPSEKNCNAATVDAIHNDSMNSRQEEESVALNEKAEVQMRSHDNFQRNQNLDVNAEETPNTDINQADAKNDAETEASHNADDLNCPVENVFLNKNVTKPYMDNIRRLSLDIVKDVINSARSSIHELHNKAEQAKDKSNGDPAETNNADSASNGSSEQPFHKASEYGNSRMKESSMLKEDFSDTIDEDTICGFGCFKPQWLQKWATPKVYLFVFSLIGVVHGAYYNYFVAMISTLEKRYAFRSKVSGTLLLADEITPLVLGIIVGYIGGKTHRPRMVALGMFLSATCCFVTALPYLIYGSAKHLKEQTVKNITSMEFCDTAFNNSSCNEDDQPPTMSVVGLFLFASFLKGFATLSYYVIGIPYMDDNAKKKYSPLYLGRKENTIYEDEVLI